MIPIKGKYPKNSFNSRLSPMDGERDSLTQISNSIKILADRINDLCTSQARMHEPNMPDQFANQNRLEDRFQRVFEEIPKLPEPSQHNDEERKHMT